MGSRCSRAWLFRIASNLSNLWIDRGRALQPEPEPDPEFRAGMYGGPTSAARSCSSSNGECSTEQEEWLPELGSNQRPTD